MFRQIVQNIVLRISNSNASGSNRARSASRRAPKSLRGRNLRLEQLEDRALLSVATAEYAEIRATYPALNLPADVGEINVVDVDITADSASSLANLKKAIETASESSKSDLIVVRTTDSYNTIEYKSANDKIEINLATEDKGAVYIVALGTKPLTIDGAGQQCSVISVSEYATLGVANLTITGAYNCRTRNFGSGGGVNNVGTLITVNTTITENVAGYVGGGVYNNGKFTAVNTTISNNETVEGFGGGVYVNSGTFTSVNTIIRDNYADQGGGVSVSGGSFFSLENTIISNNTAYDCGGGVYNSADGGFVATNTTICGNEVEQGGTDKGYGGGVFNLGTFKVVNVTIAGNYGFFGGGVANLENASFNAINTIIARNTAGCDPEYVDVYAYEVADVYGYSSLSSFNEWKNKVDGGNIYDDGSTQLFDMDKGDYSLADDSLALDKGDNSYVDGSKEEEGYKKLETDIVGNPRIVYGKVDIGAYEYSKSITVDGDFAALKSAIESAVNGDTIKFASGVTFNFTETITLSNKSITIDGTGADVSFDGGEATRLFDVKSGAALTLKSVTLQNAASADGGAIRNAGTLTLNGVAFADNKATNRGGAIYNSLTGKMVVTGAPTTFDGNSAAKGGALANYGTTTINIGAKVEFADNSATQYGGAYFGCGGLQVEGMAIFSDNKAAAESSKGGAIYNGVYTKDSKTTCGQISITGSALFSSNSAFSRGGAIVTYGDPSKDYAALDISGVAAFANNSTKADDYSYGGAIDVGKSAKAVFAGTLEFNGNGKISENEVGTSYGGAIYSAGAVSFGAKGTYKFINNSSLESGGAINASNYNETSGNGYVAGLLALNGAFKFNGNTRVYNSSEKYTGYAGYGGAIATAAPTTIGKNTTTFSYENNSAPRGNCVAIDTISVAANKDLLPENFGLTAGADYTTFDVLNYRTASASSAILPTSIASDATKATIMVEGVSKTFGMEGIAPQELGLGAGVYETLVQYEDGAGVKSAVYSLVLTVDQGATLEVRETSIANGRGVKFDFNLNKDGRAVSEWIVSWGDGTTTRSARLSSSWMAAHYYAQDGVFDVSLTAVYLDGTSETFEKFSTQKIGKTIESEVLATCFNQIDDVFDELENLIPYGPSPRKR